MKSKTLVSLSLLCAGLLAGCSTSGTFRVPPGSQLYVYERPVQVQGDGKVTTNPFFWTAAGGVPYRLEQNGKVTQEGKLEAKFRPVSIFWPPAALIYWPIGLRPDITYDLVNQTQK